MKFIKINFIKMNIETIKLKQKIVNHYDREDTIATFVLCIIIFFLIGFPLFLMGCNKDVTDVCIPYDIYNGQISGYRLNEQSCSSCTKRSRNGCEEHSHYICYNAYVLASNNLNQTDFDCELLVANEVTSEKEANNSMFNYNIGDNVCWYKNNKKCVSSDFGSVTVNYWYSGLVLLSFTGLLILSLLFYSFTTISNRTHQKINNINI